VGAMQNVFLLDQAEKVNYITIPLDRVENTKDILSVPNPIMSYIVSAQLII
jgi:hypothetical protein